MSGAVSHAKGEEGFTLVELMVVVLVIAILAAIAIPGLLSRRTGAADAGAKEMANTAEHASLIYSLNNPSGFVGLTPTALKSVEPTLNIVVNGQTVLAAAGPTAGGYQVIVVSSVGDTFNVTSTNGIISRTCSIASGNGNTTTNTGGGCKNGTW